MMVIFSVKASGARRWILSSAAVLSAGIVAVPALLPDSAADLLPTGAVARAAANTEVTPSDLAGRIDPGAQLSRAREYMERQRVEQQLEENRKKQDTKVETEGQKPEQAEKQIRFQVNKIETDPSEILTEGEISRITETYVGKTVSLQDLYDVADAISKLYEEKGYSICKAYLPPQRIHGGVVRINLLEGKTGNVTLDGLRFTRPSYVTNRIRLEPGKVANTDRLNEQLQRFNATNDVQLRVLVHAGEKPGTTDYEIAALEPKTNQSVSLYVDNNGYETSGRWREGIFYTNRSLTGQRDDLRFNYLRSEGTHVVGLNYSMPVNEQGTMLDFDFGANRTKVTRGDLSNYGMIGHSWVAGFTLRHPLRTDQKRRDEIGFQFLYQDSETDFGSNIGHRQNVVDDSRYSFSPYISFTHYGKSSVLYHKHSLAYNRFSNKVGTGDNYPVYKLDVIYQKQLGGGQMLSGRFNAQVASESKTISPSDKFYIGGSGSVRGYEESFLAGNQGFSASLSYLAPLDKKRIFNAFTFVDYGRVFGDERTTVDQTLVSTGVGLTVNYKNFYSNLTLGIPLKREFKSRTDKVDRTRIHFNCSVTF